MKRFPIHALPAAPVEPRWRARHLLIAPHRLAFFAAALMWSASGLWWAWVLIARVREQPVPWALPASAAHALWMCFGFMPLFITGFWFTAGPRWLGLPPVDARRLLVPVSALLSSWAVAVPGFHSSPVWVALGLALGACTWTLLCKRFVGLLRASRAADKQHATVMTIACAIGALAWWLAAVAAALGQVLLLRSAACIALWCFVAPLFLVMSHRMLPFFDGAGPQRLEARYPLALVGLVCAMLGERGVVAVAELGWWSLPTWALWVQMLLEAFTAAWLLWLALRSALRRQLRNRLLLMLHGGLLWLALSFVLAAVSHAGSASGRPALQLGLAPLHAMTMGYLGSTLLATITRVVSGHQGRAVAVDHLAWGLYCLLQAAVLLRLAVSAWPAAAMALVVASVLAWCAASSGWAVRYGRWLGHAEITRP